MPAAPGAQAAAGTQGCLGVPLSPAPSTQAHLHQLSRQVWIVLHPLPAQPVQRGLLLVWRTRRPQPHPPVVEGRHRAVGGRHRRGRRPADGQRAGRCGRVLLPAAHKVRRRGIAATHAGTGRVVGAGERSNTDLLVGAAAAAAAAPRPAQRTCRLPERLLLPGPAPGGALRPPGASQRPLPVAGRPCPWEAPWRAAEWMGSTTGHSQTCPGLGRVSSCCCAPLHGACSLARGPHPPRLLIAHFTDQQRCTAPRPPTPCSCPGESCACRVACCSAGDAASEEQCTIAMPHRNLTAASLPPRRCPAAARPAAARRPARVLAMAAQVKSGITLNSSPSEQQLKVR